MGEKKRRDQAKPEHLRLLEDLTRKLLDQGLIIEAGWQTFRAASVPPDADPMQVRDMRWSFFAGAQHLFGSIMTGLEEDREPTEADLKRMSLINAELKRFYDELTATLPTEGKG